MILEIATVIGLAQQCAPSVAIETLVSLVHTESRFNPYAIGINAKGVAPPKVSDRAAAAAAARSLIARGYNVDLGLGQINSANLKWLGLSVEDAFDPCRNLAAAARVLSSNYLSVARSSPSTQAAIATAMSMYNTGSRSRGFGNGYVSRVFASSSVVVPAIRGQQPPAPVVSIPFQSVTPATQEFTTPSLRTDEAKWDISAGAQTARLMVFGGKASNSLKGQSE
jgi:type IV secretion system protein VirB1